MRRMRPDELKRIPLDRLKGVGNKRAGMFAGLGIYSCYDLLFHFPRAYEDWTVKTIEEAVPGSVCAVKGTVSAPLKKNMVRRGLTIYKGSVFDGTGKMNISLFNTAYAAASLRQGEEFVFYGRIEGHPRSKSMSSPKFMPSASAPPIRPLYPAGQGLTQTVISGAVKDLLSRVDVIDDPLPEEMRVRLSLCPLDEAVRTVHGPESGEKLDRAVRRLTFEELFCMQLGLLYIGKTERAHTGKVARRCDMSPFFLSLPFKPTKAQMRAMREAAADMMKNVPMNRLLQGDVGSGKTVVAAGLMYFAWKSGFQSVMMVPTEILAEQHCATLKKLLSPLGMTVELLTSSVRGAEREELLERVANGVTSVLVGTHAVIGDRVEFYNVGLAVTDEQHRFGVRQRRKLTEKGGPAHTLVMSATPIPRTLALIIYGDLDISVLDELPPGRREIRTYCVGSGARERVNGFIEKHIRAGRQVYVVCPAIDDGSEDSAVLRHKRLTERFPGARVGLLHGKMKPADKEKAMRMFAEGKTDVLVSTTVIEVGVDVPNATLMIVEEAEKFGLSQLHQLRGRVGRSDRQSFCVLISDVKGDEAEERLKAMCSCSDGFEIAKKDLELRGPGDFFGSRQHGLPLLRIADLHSDMDILESAAEEAKKLYSSDPDLSEPEHEPLREEVNALFEQDSGA